VRSCAGRGSGRADAGLARRIERVLERIEAIGHEHFAASIGIAVYPVDGRTPDELPANADGDLRRAKELRRAAIRRPAAPSA